MSVAVTSLFESSFGLAVHITVKNLFSRTGLSRGAGKLQRKTCLSEGCE